MPPIVHVSKIQSEWTITAPVFMTQSKAFKKSSESKYIATLMCLKGKKDKRLCILSLQKIVGFILFHYSSEQAIVKPLTTKQIILLWCRFVIVCIFFVDIQLCDQWTASDCNRNTNLSSNLGARCWHVARWLTSVLCSSIMAPDDILFPVCNHKI